MSCIVVNGVEIEYEEIGSADDPAFVMIRGLGTQLIDWPEIFLLGLVAEGFRVVIFDNRDAGLSQKFNGFPNFSNVARKTEIPPYSIYDMAEDIVGLMDALGIKRAHLFGISMGGIIGQIFAAKHGNRLLSFFSVMSSTSRKGLPSSERDAAATMALSPEVQTGQSFINTSAENLRICGSPDYPLSVIEGERIAVSRYERNYAPDGEVRQMAAIIAGGCRLELLASIRVPTMVLHGIDDPLISLESGKDTAKTIPLARFEAIPGMGHDLSPTLAPVLLKHVVKFINSLEKI